MPTLPLATRQANVNATVDRIDAGSGAGVLEIRTGAAPGADAADSGTLLATLTFSDPAFGNADSSAVATAGAITSSSSAHATGTAGHAVVKTSAGARVMLLSVGVSGSGAEVILPTLSIVAGAAVSVSSLTVTQEA